MEFEEIDRDDIGNLNHLGDFIAFCRTEKGLSQRQLALYADISNTELHRIETAQRQKPSPKILEKIAKVLDIEYEILLQYAGYLDLQDGIEQSSNLNYSSLSDEERDFILEYLQNKWNKEKPFDSKPFSKSDIEKILFATPQKIELNDMEMAFASGIKGLNKENQEIAKNIIEGLLAKQKNEENKEEK